MKIKINYYGKFKIITKKDQELVDVSDSCSLVMLMQKISEQYGKDFQSIAFVDEKKLQPSLLIVINNVTVDKTKEFSLKDGDEIRLLIAIAGG